MALNKTGNLSGSKTGKDPCLFPQHSQTELSSGVSNTGHNVHNNVTKQAGEKFSVNFGHDGIAVGRVPVSPLISQNCENLFGLNRENGNVRYEDLTKILGLRRVDSENSSDIFDFVSIKQPAQEMENGAAVNILSKIQNGDGVLRKVVHEPIGDQPGLGLAVPTLRRYEASQSNGFSGSGTLDDSLPGKMKFLCSFGGKILPRPSDGKLRNVGGDTHIISIRTDISWEELMKKTLGICNQPHTIKYQLPGEDLDALISVSSDEDLQNLKEEYHGLKRLEGSQKLRIFLVPLGETEETSSTDASAVQLSDPDYQYVAAVNGLIDPTRINQSGEQSLTNGASQPATGLNFAPGSQKTPHVSSPLEIRDGINAFNPDGILNDSLNFQRPLPISPTPIQVTGTGTGYIQLLGNNSCQGSIESNASFTTAQLHHEYSSISIADCRYHQQLATTTLSNNSHQHGDVGQPKKVNGGHFEDHNSGKELVTTVYVNPSDGFSEVFGGRSLQKERRVFSGNPLSCLDDPIHQQGESYGITDSPHAIPHAFSDPQLHESGARSGYFSQDRIGQSFSLNLEKAQLASMLHPSVSQVSLMEHLHGSVVHHPQMQSNIPKVESAELHRRQDLASSSAYFESFGMHDHMHMDGILSEKNYRIAQTDLSESGYLAKDTQESSVKLERMKIVEEKNPIPKKDCKVYGGKSTVTDMGHVTDLHPLDPFTANNLNAKANMQKNWELRSEGIFPAPSGMMGLSLNNLVEKTLSDHDMCHRTSDGKKCALSEGLNGEQGTNFSLTRNFDLNAPILNCEVGSCDKSYQGDYMFKQSADSDSLKASQIQPSENRVATGFQEIPTVSPASFYPAALHDDLGPSLNMPMNCLDNPSNIISFKMAPSLLDDLITSTGQMVDQFIPKHSASGKSKVDDKISGQPKKLERCNDANLTEPIVIVEDMATSAVPPYIESSSVCNPHNSDEEESSVVSPSHTEAESIIPESETEDFNDDETEKNEFLSDAMIAEMEASIYGLQIIRNSDLEELTELGSGTYGTVYHGKWRGTDVAIKRIKKGCFAGRSSEQERLITRSS
ncbi:uncharacterized protein LOC113862751 isoform X2 [Abrus precatorius]|uniref:Uncharacterized protein LOC113862751 isoform X2 n=1 Tax=Abrus precatorius TaxID=3816 RepID=A0A8B8L694_ABRPR|nr:uncharacterized protein LOC113862751 isoform X2 [Abrus precatorius]